MANRYLCHSEYVIDFHVTGIEIDNGEMLIEMDTH